MEKHSSSMRKSHMGVLKSLLYQKDLMCSLKAAYSSPGIEQYSEPYVI